jgi:hypothetical protein
MNDPEILLLAFLALVVAGLWAWDIASPRVVEVRDPDGVLDSYEQVVEDLNDGKE